MDDQPQARPVCNQHYILAAGLWGVCGDGR
jgi:hypothetical protein